MENAIFIGIHLLVPLAGVSVFVWLCKKMISENIPETPVVPWFILFGTYGAWLVVILTGLFWEWSGMASLGVFYLVLPGPFVTAGSAFLLKDFRQLSAYHRNAFRLSVAYTCAMGVLIPVWLVSAHIMRERGW